MLEPCMMWDSYMWLFNNTNSCDKKWEYVRVVTNETPENC